MLFTHELTHLRAGTFRGFRIAWNLLCGIPFLMPSFMYYTHVDHHMRKHFGTERDGEYLPLATRPWWHLLLYLCQPFVVPMIAVVRFLILAPVSWISPALSRLGAPSRLIDGDRPELHSAAAHRGRRCGLSGCRRCCASCGPPAWRRHWSPAWCHSGS